MIEQTASHSTIFGKWWIAFVFIFRIIVVASIGENVYLDEQEEFICNSHSPGCEQVCYNDFAPISHIRFWSFQILLTCSPTVIFIMFAMHHLSKVAGKKDETSEKVTNVATPIAVYKQRKVLKEKNKLTNKPAANNKFKPIEFDTKSSKLDSKISTRSHLDDEITESLKIRLRSRLEEERKERKVIRVKTTVVRAYVIHVIIRTIIEGAGLYGQYKLFGWKVPEITQCSRDPCLLVVNCYVSRPKEKEVFMLFMFAVGVLCIFFNLLEIFYLGWRRFLWESMKKDLEASSESSSMIGTPKANRVIHRKVPLAPPGFYIPDVEPPSAKYRVPQSGFPVVRVPRGSYSDADSEDRFLTSDDDSFGGERRRRTFHHIIQEEDF